MKLPKIIELILCLSVVVLAVLLYKSTASFPETSQDTTAVYVKFLSISLGVLGLAQILISFLNKDKIKNFVEEPKKFVLLMFSLIGYVFILDKVGFIVASMLFLPVTMFFMGYENKKKSVIISIGITLFVYILFVKIFEIQLPAASLWN